MKAEMKGRWRNSILFCIGLTSLPVTSCVFATQRPNLDAEVRQFAEDMLVILRNKDIDRVLSFYEQSDAFVHIEGGGMKKWPELEKDIRKFLSMVKENNLRWQGQPQVLFLSNDLAVIYGRHTFSATLHDGRALPSHSGMWSGVVRKTPSGWKIVYSHSSEDELR